MQTKDIALVGNFVLDLLVHHKTTGIERTSAIGGSVTYGSITVAKFGGVKPRVISYMCSDFPQLFFDRLVKYGVSMESTKLITNGKTTSYMLSYDENNVRTLSLHEKGLPIDIRLVMENIGYPAAILFVPIAAEVDEDLVVQVVTEFKKRKMQQQTVDSTIKIFEPIIGIDVQGFLRCFDGQKVMARSTEQMHKKMKILGGVVTFLKAEHGEAISVLGQDLTPKKCADKLRAEYGFPIVSVTMGPGGSYISSEQTGTLYVPTFKPDVVKDETGCGDVFLAATISEMLLSLENIKIPPSEDKPIYSYLSKDDIIRAVEYGSCAASYKAQQVGPEGLASRDDIIKRVKLGIRQSYKDRDEKRFSVTKYDKEDDQ